MVDLLPRLAGRIIVPVAVVSELEAGRSKGLFLPDPALFPWVTVQSPACLPALSLARDLGPGESQVLALALEGGSKSTVILDDKMARQIAKVMGIPHVGTIGVLIQAKRAGFVAELSPLLYRLDALGFRLSKQTRQAALKMAGEG